MTDNRDANRALLQAIVAMFNTGDVSAADKVFAADYIDHQKPVDWEIDGPEEFCQIVSFAKANTRRLQVDIQDQVIDEDRIAARLLWRGEDHQGVKLHRETLEILHIRDGKVTEHWGAEAWRSAL